MFITEHKIKFKSTDKKALQFDWRQILDFSYFLQFKFVHKSNFACMTNIDFLTRHFVLYKSVSEIQVIYICDTNLTSMQAITLS